MADVPYFAPAHSRPALAGREREQTTLRAALDRALTGHGSLVLISGEAGIGKTSLAEALCREAADRGALVLVGRCYDLSETPPYGPWRELFTSAPHDADLPALPTAVLPSEHTGAALASQEAIIARMQTYLTALAARQPLVVLLDDLHWADSASLDLLRVLARDLADQPLFILATYRTEEVPRHHPLYALLPALVREVRAVRIDVRPLTDDAVRALVANRYALPADDAVRLVTHLQAQAEGNALYLGELLRSLEEADILHRSATGWTLGDPTVQPVPPLLQQVIDARVTRLGAEAGELLAVAAVLGQAVLFHLWVTVSGAPEETILGLTERAVAARLLADAPDGAGMYFAHALIREALYAGTTARRRRQTHQRAGEVLAARPDADPDVVAYHFRAASDPRAVAWLVRAAERALRAYADQTAATRCETALTLLQDDPAHVRERGWLSFHIARLRRYDDPQRGLDLLTAAARLATETGDPVLAAYATAQRGILQTILGAPRRGIADLELGVAALTALPPGAEPVLPPTNVQTTPGYFRSQLVLWLAGVGRYAEALAAADQMLAECVGAEASAEHTQQQTYRVRDQTPLALEGIYRAWSMARAALGRPTETGPAFASARAVIHALGHRSNLALVATSEAVWVALPYQADRPAVRRALAAEAIESLARVDSGIGVGWPLQIHLLPLLLVEGAWVDARVLADTLLGLLADRRAGLLERLAVGAAGELAHEQGDDERVRWLLDQTLPHGPETPPGNVEFAPALALQRLAATLALDTGDLSAAHAWLAAHDRWLTRSGAVLGQAEGQLGWAAYHRAAGDTGQARQCAETALAHATEPRQPLALLTAHRLLGELATAAGDHAAAQAHLDEALALADACAAPYERALTLLAQAEFQVATDRPGKAQVALTAAQALLAPLDARPALARAATIATRLAAPPTTATPDGLSRREVEVLRLLAAGQRNQAIAEALFLSPRTVQRHIANVYLKIGAHNRAEATTYALRHQLT
ncbi:MAG: helix-turn-helix transcriptional regulator [Thermomicrobiales bacterium]